MIELIELKKKQPKKKYDFKIDSSTPFRNPFFTQDRWNENGKGLINYNYLMSTKIIKFMNDEGEENFNDHIKKIKKAYKKHKKIRLFYNNEMEGIIIRNILHIILKV